MKASFIILLGFFVLSACAPYAKGPVLSVEEAQNTFQPIVEFMGVEPGMAVADVGAGSGALTVIMATQLDSCEVYIQDIDRKMLQQDNVDKMITHYSKQLGHNLGERNQFHLVYGTPNQSNLPHESIDIVYSNATMHVFNEPDAMLQDLRKKLKPTGKIFIRDGFKGENGEGEFCSSRKCAKRLLSIDEFLVMMEQNGYRLIKQSPDMDGYPLFGFELSN
ncbi:class I SAM-dependent methyltransferase [Tunicatimonas pelagia]|uniref:class I SAM-dependent methyltransferase n=1 Tax=Tunicatimonas pelagia TaxID=931531 RepID=UPI002666DB6F|nr:class I SAM-dependent methyltransferase [Tunicatimonas pelagia]WKN43923.1 methyltransferase domain-containing protein [Tunicatimonas pelagia]